MKQHSKRHHRGVILTLKGWDKLQKAKAEAESNENATHHFTLEELGARMVLALHTVMWRSLQNAPSQEEQLTNILQLLLWSLRKEVTVPGRQM